ncbi:beta-flanking protein [Scleroderma citrinum]
MDTFMNLAKKGYEAYSESQSPQSRSDFSRTGGEEYNTPHHRQAQSDRPDFDHDEVARQATHHSEGTGDSSLFASAMNFVQGRPNEHEEPIDENQVRDAHNRAYNQGSASSLSANSLGSAAAMQVFKQFTGGGKGSGSSQNELISMAMGEASKLFDKSGASSGGKQDAVNGAAMTVTKLVVQSKFKSAVGGSDSGGLGSLMGMVSIQIHVSE